MRQQAQRTRIQPGDVPITLSGGLVLMRAGERIDDAVKRADELLYHAKSNGRDQIASDL
jgi:PleD family two-component response regulator